MDSDLALLMSKLGLNPMTLMQAAGQGASPIGAPSMDRNVLGLLLQRARAMAQYDPRLMQTLRAVAARVHQMSLPEQVPFKPPVEFGGMNSLPFPVPQQLVQHLMQYLNPQG